MSQAMKQCYSTTQVTQTIRTPEENTSSPFPSIVPLVPICFIRGLGSRFRRVQAMPL